MPRPRPLVVMNEDIHYAREVQKIASAGLCAFSSPNRGRAGVMHGGVPKFYSRNATTHSTQSEFSLALLEKSGWPAWASCTRTRTCRPT